MTQYIKMNKRLARKFYKMGKAFIAIPCKLDPANRFWANGAVIDKYTVPDFDKACNQLEYYNCGYHTGYYLAFYREE